MRGEFVWQLLEHLVALYAAAMNLPLGMSDDDFDAPEAMTSEDWWELYQRLGKKLSEVNEYSFMFDPYDFDSTPVTGSLADDAADIYRDIRRGLAVIGAGDSLENAVWEWQTSFDHHWGRHAAHAIHALHSLTHSGSVRWINRDE